MTSTPQAPSKTAEHTLHSVPASQHSAPARLEVSGVTKEFHRRSGETFRAVDDVSFEVRQGELLVLLGPSGCGKSTLLRSIAGLESPTSGRISIDGKAVYDTASRIDTTPDQRDINMMFQSYALWPHMTLEDNVAYPLRTAGVRRAAARSRANEYLDLVGLEGLGQQHPGTISGGQQQRVALARTLISEPSVVLFDEPLSNVDARVRVRLRGLLVRLHRQLDFAAVYVTHDQVEAMGLGTRIAVMRSGRIDQLATPVTVYDSPANRSTAEFIGEANFWPVRVTDLNGGAVLAHVSDDQPLRMPLDGWPAGHVPAAGDHLTLMARPEKCLLRPVTPDSPAGWVGTVAEYTYSGAYTEYQVQLREGVAKVWTLGPPDPDFDLGARAYVEIPDAAIRVVADD